MDGCDFLNRRLFNDALLVMHRGRVVHESYRNGMTAADHHVQHSTTKSLTTMLLAQAIDAGRMDPAAPFDRYLPELKALDGWHGVTLQHVLDMASRREIRRVVRGPQFRLPLLRPRRRLLSRARQRVDRGAPLVDRHMTQRDAAPGIRFNYASPLTNALMMAVEHALEAPILDCSKSACFSASAPNRSAGSTPMVWVFRSPRAN